MHKIRLKHKTSRNGFRGHPNYRNAHNQILNNPFKAEADYFDTRDFAPSRFFWNLEAASCNHTSVSDIANRLRKYWGDICSSGKEVSTILRDIPEMDAEAMANRQLLQEYRKLPAEVCGEIERTGVVIMDFHEEPYWGDPGKVAVLHGQKEHDSSFHFVYLTADLISAHYHFTLFITSRVEGFPIVSYLPALLAQVRQVTEPRLFLFDGEFPTAKVLSYLEREQLP